MNEYNKLTGFWSHNILSGKHAMWEHNPGNANSLTRYQFPEFINNCPEMHNYHGERCT